MGARRGNKFGWHSGTLLCKDGKFLGDLYIQDDIVFSDVSAGTLGVTGGIDMQSTTSAIGIDLGGTFSTCAININGTATTGIKIEGIGGTTTEHAISVGGATPLVYTGGEGAINSEIYSTFTGNTGFFRGLYVESTYTPAASSAAASVYGIRGKAILTTAKTFNAAEHLAGVHGYCQVTGNLGHALAVMAGVRGEVYQTGTLTTARWVCGGEFSVKGTSQVSTGALAALVAYSTTQNADSVLHIEGYFDYGINFTNLDGTNLGAFKFAASGHLAAEGAAQDATVTCDGKIKVVIGSHTMYIPAYAGTVTLKAS